MTNGSGSAFLDKQQLSPHTEAERRIPRIDWKQFQHEVDKITAGSWKKIDAKNSVWKENDSIESVCGFSEFSDQENSWKGFDLTKKSNITAHM